MMGRYGARWSEPKLESLSLLESLCLSRGRFYIIFKVTVSLSVYFLSPLFSFFFLLLALYAVPLLIQ